MRENKKKSCNNHYGKLANTKIQQKAIANRKKASPLNQINRNGEAFDLSRCLQMKKKKKKKSGPFIQPCKGKSVSTNITEQQMDIDQEAIGIQFHEEIIMEILSSFCCGTPPQENQFYFPIQNLHCVIGYADWDMMQLVMANKILAINVDPMSDGDDIFTEILALKSDSWRKNCKYPTGIRRVVGFFGCGQDYLAFLHGAFHWLGLSQCYTIVSFNISSELYGEIPLPERMCNLFYARNIEHGISVLGGMLCFYSTYNTHGNGIFKLWVMKDYGVEESWTELLTVRDTNLFYSGIPRYMFADGEVLLHCRTMGCLGSVYTTSRGPFGLTPQHVTLENVTFKQGITYAPDRSKITHLIFAYV